ncbi:hypothetical protein F5B19DRAFT_464030 [Rostrohypoxylon terebratum]|nr:hypothetical protein F5B19DRAFT_464030 [Rostrohypoxylon terebratum]
MSNQHYMLILYVLITISCTPFSILAKETIAIRLAGYPFEHVILADCGEGAQQVSEAAYYQRIQNEPNDTAPVFTDDRVHSWTNSYLRTYFENAHTEFTASLGPEVKDGEIAGTAYDEYVNYTCYQMPSTYVYNSSNDLGCFQRYYCGHGVPLSIGTTSSALPSATSSTISLPFPTLTSSASNDSKSLSAGEIIGISSGAILGVLFVVGMAIMMIWRRRIRMKEDPKALDHRSAEEIVRKPEIPPMSEADGFPAGSELETPLPTYELGGPCRPVEIHSYPIAELEGDWKLVRWA